MLQHAERLDGMESAIILSGYSVMLTGTESALRRYARGTHGVLAEAVAEGYSAKGVHRQARDGRAFLEVTERVILRHPEKPVVRVRRVVELLQPPGARKATKKNGCTRSNPTRVL